MGLRSSNTPEPPATPPIAHADDPPRAPEGFGPLVDYAQRQHLLHALQQFAWIGGADGTIEYVSARWWQMAGLDPNSDPRDLWQRVVHPDDQETLDVARRRACRAGSSYALEVRLKDAGGSYRWHSVQVEPLRGRHGEPVGGWYGSAVDIHDFRAAALADAPGDPSGAPPPAPAPQPEDRPTAQLLAGDRLAELEQIYRYTPVGLFAIDARYRVLRINERMAEINGFPIEQHLGRDIRELTPAIADRLEAIFRAVLDRGEPQLGIEFRSALPSRPGDLRDWYVNYFPLRHGGNGSVEGIVGAVLDVTQLKRTSVALAENERRLELAAELAGVGFFEYGDSWESPVFSEQMYRIHGLAPGTPVAPGAIAAMIHPDDQAAFRATHDAVIASRAGEFTLEYRIVRPDGEVRSLAYRARLRYADGEPPRVAHILGVVQDITDRRSAEAVREAAAARLAVLLQLETRTRSASTARAAVTAACEVLGRALDADLCLLAEVQPDGEHTLVESEWRGRDTRSLLGRHRLADFSAERAAAMLAGEIVQVEDATTDPRIAGSPAAQAYAAAGMRASLDVPLSRGGRVRAMLSFGCVQPRRWRATDIALARELTERLWDAAERARAEEALQRSELEFRTLADNMSQFAWMADETGARFWYNKRWFDYTGTTLEQMQGDGWRALQHPDHVERVVRTYEHSIATGEPWEATLPLRGRDGRYRWFLSRAVPIRDADGRILRWFGTNTDITEQRAAEAALRKADRRKDEFLATLAHELRNPLAPLRNALQILEQTRQPDIAAQARAMMARQLAQLVRLVDDLLDISRITAGKIKLERDRLDLQQIVHQAIENARPQIEGKGHRLLLVPPQRRIHVIGDAVRLAQVLTNLLNNAAKYSEPGGTITVRTEALPDQRARVAVEDRGIGLDPESLRHVFELFTQIEHGRDKSQGGLGIGLALAQRLAEMHGGRLYADSAGRGKGATFTLELPTAPALVRDAPRSEDAAPGPPQRRCQLVIADDNRDAADSLAIMLKLEGHEVSTCYDGRSALEMIRARRPQVAIIDVGMPEFDGLQVARAVRADPALASVCLVALTGWGQDDDRRRTAEAGFDHHFTKPLEIPVLEALLGQLTHCRDD